MGMLLNLFLALAAAVVGGYKVVSYWSTEMPSDVVVEAGLLIGVCLYNSFRALSKSKKMEHY